MRNVIRINDGWLFTLDGKTETVNLPHTWNAFDGQDGTNGYLRTKATYSKELPKSDKKTFLECRGVNSKAEVRVNNELVAVHEVTVYDEVEKEIKKDKASRLHARRQMLKVLYDVTDVPTARAGKKKNTKKVDMPAKLFDELAPKYANRNGGYSRIVKIGQRKGDGAMEVLLELV